MIIRHYSEGAGPFDRTVLLRCLPDDVSHWWVEHRMQMYRELGYGVSLNERAVTLPRPPADAQGD